MNYDLIPIAMTRVAWGDYIKFVEKYLGYSPTRGLDDFNIKVTEPKAYLATLDLQNQPNKQLSNYDATWEHVHYSFMLKISRSLVLSFMLAAPRCKIVYYSIPDSDDMLLLLSGSMGEWYETLILGCRDLVKSKIRIIYNHILQYFEQAGFKSIWSDFEKHTQVDNTFILKRK